MPSGRPSPISQVIDHDQNGREVTVAERITEWVRTGQFVELAAAAVGVHKDTLYEWLKTAGRARIRAKGRDLDQLDLTAHEAACIRFSDGVLQATAQWAARANFDLDRLSRGGIELTTTRSQAKYAIEREFNTETGEIREVERLVERTVNTTTETTLPDARVLMWRLERRLQPYFGHRVEIETSGADATPRIPEEEVSESLADALEAWLANRHGDEQPTVAPIGEQVAEVASSAPAKRARQPRDERGHVIDEVPHPNGDA